MLLALQCERPTNVWKARLPCLMVCPTHTKDVLATIPACIALCSCCRHAHATVLQYTCTVPDLFVVWCLMPMPGRVPACVGTVSFLRSRLGVVDFVCREATVLLPCVDCGFALRWLVDCSSRACVRVCLGCAVRWPCSRDALKVLCFECALDGRVAFELLRASPQSKYPWRCKAKP